MMMGFGCSSSGFPLTAPPSPNFHRKLGGVFRELRLYHTCRSQRSDQSDNSGESRVSESCCGIFAGSMRDRNGMKICTDTIEWEGSRETLRAQMIDLIPSTPDDHTLLRLAAVALDCDPLDLTLERDKAA